MTVRSYFNWAPSSEFVSSSIPSWQILTAHAQSFRGARDLAFCLKVSLESLLAWARMRRLAWTFAARICYKYQIRLTRSNCLCSTNIPGYVSDSPRPKDHTAYNVSARYGSQALLILVSVGNPPPRYTWFHQGQLLPDTIARTARPNIGYVNVTDVDFDDYGNYTVILNNSVGSYQAVYTLIPRGKAKIFNPYLPNRLFHPYQLDEYISKLRGVWCTFSFLFNFWQQTV